MKVDVGKVGKTPSVGVMVRHAKSVVAVHLSPDEARAHAKALLDAADQVAAATAAPVAERTPAPDRMAKA